MKARPGNGPRRPAPDWDEMLGRFSDALGITETACIALEAAEEDLQPSASPAILTLRQGMKALQRVYNELDLAIGKLNREVRRG